MRKRSLLANMVIVGCLLSILPVFFVGIFSYVQSSRQVQEQARQAEMQYIKQANSNIEQILVTVNHTLTNLADSTVMEKALRRQMTEYDFQLYNELRNEISHLQAFDTKVDDVVILNRKQDWLIKNSGLYRLDGHVDGKVYESYFNLPTNTSWVLLDNRKLSDPVPTACPYTISLVRKLPVKEAQSYGLAFANIPSCDLADMIDYQQGVKEVMVVDDRGKIVVDRDRSMIGKPMSGTPYFRADRPFSGDSGQYQVHSNNRSFLVTYYKSRMNHWIYLSIVSIDSLTRESRQIGWITIWICLGIVAVSVGFVWLASQRIYSPVKQLTQWIERSSPELHQPRQSEMQLIQAHMQSLFSSNTEMEREIQSHSREMRSLFMRQLYGGMLRHAEIAEKLANFGLEETVAEWRRMSVLTIAVDTLENTRYERKDMDLLLFAVANIVDETIPPENRFPSVWIDQTLVVLVGFGATEAAHLNDRLYEWTELLLARLQEYLHLSVSIGISLPFTDIKQAARGYREGADALMQRLKLGGGVTVHYENLNAASQTFVNHYPIRTEMELMDAIKVADKEAAFEFLHAWIERAFKNAETPQEYHVSMMRLLNSFMTVLQETGIRFDQINAEHAPLYEELLGLHIRADIEEWFANRLVLPMIRVFEDRGESRYHDLSEQIIEWIHKHYESDLTLEECAKALHYNANYLSSVFKKETGSTFSEYLAGYRLHMAKKWLLETDMTVKEISDKLRYTNPQNFIRSFRKQEGMTPGQYRALKA